MEEATLLAHDTNLEQLEDSGARLANGEIMDLYSVPDKIFLYGIGLEGDEHLKGPLFYSPGDAILHALNPAYMPDTIGFSHSGTEEGFRFNSALRLREYRLESKTFFYDGRGRIRPPCSSVGVTNFKSDFYLLLPMGNDRRRKIQPIGLSRPGLAGSNPVGSSAASSYTEDEILENIVSGITAYVRVRIEAFYFCQPSKILRLNNKLVIDSSALWLFYVSLLKGGYREVDIRKEAFLGERSKMVIPELLHLTAMPTTDYAPLPDNLTQAIAEGKSLDEVLQRCYSSGPADSSCTSGPLFERLWSRDVQSITNLYPQDAFQSTNSSQEVFQSGSTSDRRYLYPKAIIPYLATWFYKEDFLPEMGRGKLAYTWNYNRFLDVNTVIFWTLSTLRNPVPTPPYQKPVRLPFIMATEAYEPEHHLSLIPHRFSENEISNFKRISIYDPFKETRVSLSFDPKTEAQSLTISRGLYIMVESMNEGSANPDRGSLIQQNVLNEISGIAERLDGLLRVVMGVKDGLGRIDPRLRIVECNASNQTIHGIPSNWMVLLFVSSLLRILIGLYEFDFISFEQ